MKRLELALAGMLALPALALAQGNRPAVPEMPAQTPGASPEVPQATGSGMVRVPPSTDPKSLATPPSNIDPAMDDATGRIDKKNREKGKPKPAAKNGGQARDKRIEEYK